MPIEMKPCKHSSQVEAFGYDAATKTLAMKFKSGSTYHYDEVPQNVYDGLCQCDSIGTFLHQNIKGKFKYRRIEAGKIAERHS